jgi:prepilin-type N-terminal cleavage/methylation domain-containing protein
MNSRADRNPEAGFSLMELLIVVAIMVIMTIVAIQAMIPARASYRTDDQAQRILGFMRMAGQRALTQRQPHHLPRHRVFAPGDRFDDHDQV